MANLSADVHRHFRAQHGIASLDQLHRTGLTTRQIEHLCRAGQLIHLRRGAYASPSVEVDELAQCASLCLARPDLCISGPTAGRLWGFRHVGADRRLHVIGPPHSQPSSDPKVKVYRTAAIHPCDVIERPDGIRLTDRARTAFDLSRSLPPRRLLSVIEQALHDGDLTTTEMRRVAVDWLSKRRPWAYTFLDLLDQRLEGGSAESGAESRVGQALKRSGISGITRQHEIVLPGYGPARFDLALPRLKWAIEVDVHPSHEQTAGRESDRRRDAGASSLGWLVSRISRQEYDRSFDATIDRLLTVFAQRQSEFR